MCHYFYCMCVCMVMWVERSSVEVFDELHEVLVAMYCRISRR